MFSQKNRNKVAPLVYIIIVITFFSSSITCLADSNSCFSLDLIYFPKYIGKIPEGNSYSLPFSIKVEIRNADPFENLSIKAYIVGNISDKYPATQIWDPNEDKWCYSYYYILVKANSAGCWNGWFHLRFKREYKEYYRDIWNSSSAWLKVKCKRENGKIAELYKDVLLLDLDNSTVNGFSKGGFVSGVAKNETTIFQNKTVIIKDKNNITLDIYLTEGNNIDENFPNIPGYYKLAVPIGSGYRILIRGINTTILIDDNVTVRQGFYNFKIDLEMNIFYLKPGRIFSFDVRLINTGSLPEIIFLNLEGLPRGWSYTLEANKIFLDVNEEALITIEIYPDFQNLSSYTYKFDISGICENDPSIIYNLNISVNLKIPDLIVYNLSILRKNECINCFKEGEIVKIRAKVKNVGTENTSGFNVTFYHDSLNKSDIIGYKYYDNITNYPKYPSVYWDTKGLKEGCHRIYVVVDSDNNVFELNENNNMAECIVFIENSHPLENERKVLITEVYPYTFKNSDDEFVTIYNPTNYEIDISGWYLTDTPLKRSNNQNRIIFPNETILKPFSSICATENATTYYIERGEKPNYEYKADSQLNVPQMKLIGNFALNNNGDIVALKDRYNHTIDMVVYGDTTRVSPKGWHGDSIRAVERGFILKRKIKNNTLVDTNTSKDWRDWRKWKIGQSNFVFKNLKIRGVVTSFVSPDCSFKVLSDLIRSANRSIYMNMYEFTNPWLMDEIIDALGRNVTIKLLIEGSPAGGIDRREIFILNEISKHGCEIRLIGKDRQGYCRYNFDHAKYLIVDNETIVVESANWGKTGVPVNNTFGNREWGIMLKNKTLANYLLKIFLYDYNLSRPDVSIYDENIFPLGEYFTIDYSIPNGFYKPRFKPMGTIGTFNISLVLSPDNSLHSVLDLIRSAKNSIYMEQLYIYKSWDEKTNPLLKELVNKSKDGVNVKIILNHNPDYEHINMMNNKTVSYLKNNSVEVKHVYTNWSYFTNVHNKGIIVDNKTVFISSINWNENSFLYNRELGILVENNSNIAQYFAKAFIYDWNLKKPVYNKSFNNPEIFTGLKEKIKDYKDEICIMIIFVITTIIIAFDWRRREW